MKWLSVFVCTMVFGWIANAQSRTCTVTFQKCDIEIAGNCVKWNNKAETIQRHEARYICDELRRRYGNIRRCDTSNCGHVDRPDNRDMWQMESRRGEVLQQFGYGDNARYECTRELEYRQCREGRNPFATCVGYYRGREFDRIGPFCRR